MTASDDLFQLIKSLSKAEKIYFKRFVTLFVEKESSNYLKLFDEIEKQASKGKVYDETIIKKKSFTGKFVKNLPVHKNYLYNMLITSLSFLKKENKDLILLRQLISQCEILIDKLLYNQAKKILLRAKKIAFENENFLYMLEILNMEKVLNKVMTGNDDYGILNKKIFEEQVNILESEKNNLEYSMLYDLYGNLTNKIGTGFVRNQNELNQVSSLFENELMKDENNAKSFSSKLQFYTMYMQFHISKKDYEKAFYFSGKILELHEANMNKSGGILDSYINSLNNKLTCMVRIGKFDDDFMIVIQKMRNAESKYPKIISKKNKVFVFYSISVMLIFKYQNTFDSEGLMKHLKEVEEKLPDYESDIVLNRRIMLYYFLVTSNFVLSNYTKCIQWSGKIINLEKTDASQDYQCYVRIIYLISYYELGYLDSIEYALKSAYHFLSKRKRVYKYENIILKYLRKSFRIRNQNELYEMLEDMKVELDKIYDDPFEQNAFDAFNITYWIESRLEKKSILEIMKSKSD